MEIIVKVKKGRDAQVLLDKIKQMTETKSVKIKQSKPKKKNAKKVEAIEGRDTTVNPEDFAGMWANKEIDYESQRELAWGRRM